MADPVLEGRDGSGLVMPWETWLPEATATAKPLSELDMIHLYP